MEAILKNLDQFAEVLALSRSEYVTDWDRQTVERAFQWATYFEHVWNRFRTNAVVRQALQDRLKQINSQLSKCVDHFHFISFDDLGHSEEILHASLLTNTALSQVVYQHMLAILKKDDSTHNAFKHISHLSSLKATSHVLQYAYSGAQSQGFPVRDPVAETEAALLIQHLTDRMGLLNSPEDCQQLISRMLDPIPEAQLNRLVIAMFTNESAEGLLTVEQVLRWVLGNSCWVRDFCSSQDCKLLTELASKYCEFKTVYLSFLTAWGKGMEYGTSRAEWVSSSNSSDTSWKRLLEHFSSLLKGPMKIKEETESLLKTLKAEDGDFDVCGVSVWTDLSLVLKKTC